MLTDYNDNADSHDVIINRAHYVRYIFHDKV